MTNLCLSESNDTLLTSCPFRVTCDGLEVIPSKVMVDSCWAMWKFPLGVEDKQPAVALNVKQVWSPTEDVSHGGRSSEAAHLGD